MTGTTNYGKESLNLFGFNPADNMSHPKLSTNFSCEQNPSPEEEVGKVITTLVGYLEESNHGVLHESESLNGVNHSLSEDWERLEVELKKLDDIQKNKTEKKRSLNFYLQAKKILQTINSSLNVNSIVTASFYNLSSDDIESIDKSLKTEFDIKDPEEKSRARDVLAQNVSEQIGETERYLTLMRFFINDRAKFLTIQSTINACLQPLELAIRAEYFQKMRDIISAFEESSFYQIVSALKQLRPFIISHDGISESFYKFINSESGSEEPTLQIANFDEITKCNEFNIEKPYQHPDYLISKHYLTVINFWVNRYLLNPERNDWNMIITGDPKLRTIFELVDKLFEDIDPTLQTSWMRELKSKLDMITNSDSKWPREKNTKSTGSYKLEGIFFSKRNPHSKRLELLSLNGEIIGHYEKFYPPKGSHTTQPIEVLDNFQGNEPHFSSIFDSDYRQADKFDIGDQIIKFLNSGKTIPENHRMIFNADQNENIIDETRHGNFAFISSSSYVLLDSNLQVIPDEKCNNVSRGEGGSSIVTMNDRTKITIK